jgi:hypothetical protein
MSLSSTRSWVVAVTKELLLKWQETKSYWKDDKSLEFEHRYLQELFVRVDKAVTVIEKLDVLLAKIKKDCE